MSSFISYTLIYAMISFLFAWFLIRFKKFALIFLIIILCIIPFVKNTIHWDWFMWCKFFSIMFPNILTGLSANLSLSA
jgi:hypothetical protein